MQVDGYSLDAQRETIADYAKANNMVVVKEYLDAGKSGKNISGRPEFAQMLDDIQSGIDGVQYVLVFKLSRFGRNAADIMNSVQILEDYGVFLHSVEDYLDTGKGIGAKLLISVLSAVAEVERESIRVQTLAGRQQKAKEGKWNGGFAPYGYKLVNGELQIAEDEAEVIRFIFDNYTHTSNGFAKLVLELNEKYEKKIRQNGTLPKFSVEFVKKVVDNPVYCGKLAYGRRRLEKIQGTRNEFHTVKQSEYPVYEGIHEGIISEELWLEAQKKREASGGQNVKRYSLDHAYILSGLVKCPVCGASLYGNVSRKKKKDGSGERYKDHFYLACKHRLNLDGHDCSFRKQVKEEKINAAVEEVVLRLVNDESFKAMLTEKIGKSIDTQELEQQRKEIEKKIRQLEVNKDRVSSQLDNLDVTDKLYDRKYEDLQKRLDGFYDAIGEQEDELAIVNGKLRRVKEQANQQDSIIKLLASFEKFYDKFTDNEKKEFMHSFIKEVQIYPEEQENGRLLKSIKFLFPIIFNGTETDELYFESLDSSATVETVAYLVRQ